MKVAKIIFDSRTNRLTDICYFQINLLILSWQVTCQKYMKLLKQIYEINKKYTK